MYMWGAASAFPDLTCAPNDATAAMVGGKSGGSISKATEGDYNSMLCRRSLGVHMFTQHHVSVLDGVVSLQPLSTLLCYCSHHK